MDNIQLVKWVTAGGIRHRPSYRCIFMIIFTLKWNTQGFELIGCILLRSICMVENGVDCNPLEATLDTKNGLIHVLLYY
jgi:hypothetical protein